MKDVAVMDQMYDRNLQYFKELTMYILAGKKRLNQIRANELEVMEEKGGIHVNVEYAWKSIMNISRTVRSRFMSRIRSQKILP